MPCYASQGSQRASILAAFSLFLAAQNNQHHPTHHLKVSLSLQLQQKVMKYKVQMYSMDLVSENIGEDSSLKQEPEEGVIQATQRAKRVVSRLLSGSLLRLALAYIKGGYLAVFSPKYSPRGFLLGCQEVWRLDYSFFFIVSVPFSPLC
ncbi:hypothetical protein Nepgr_031235 [Nepenthes gracilis]|uniref:Uncharacterized protein n=1 Tax=Nepenthes gracilis TaxID=150966 RepID=A0AAD3TH60_NEPGR|nr:hypothetical protein Nepgr_031235 [Nepenthes gracilis]